MSFRQSIVESREEKPFKLRENERKPKRGLCTINECSQPSISIDFAWYEKSGELEHHKAYYHNTQCWLVFSSGYKVCITHRFLRSTRSASTRAWRRILEILLCAVFRRCRRGRDRMCQLDVRGIERKQRSFEGRVAKLKSTFQIHTAFSLTVERG